MTFKLVGGVSSEDVDGTLVLLRDDGSAAVLNRQAAALLSALVDCESVKEAAYAICTSYEVGKEEASKDIENLARELQRHGMAYDVA